MKMLQTFSKMLIYAYKKYQNETSMAFIGESIIDVSIQGIKGTLKKEHYNVSIEGIDPIARNNNIRLMDKIYSHKITIKCDRNCQFSSFNEIDHGIIIYIGEYRSSYIDDISEEIRSELSDLHKYLDVQNKYSWENSKIY